MKRKPKFVKRKYAHAYMIRARDVYIEDLLKDGGGWICEDNHKTVRQVDKCPYCSEYFRRIDELEQQAQKGDTK